MFNETDIQISPPKEQRPMSLANFERGLIEMIEMAQELDIENKHHKMFKEIRTVISKYMKKGE